jgi:hypothetical protein
MRVMNGMRGWFMKEINGTGTPSSASSVAVRF